MTDIRGQWALVTGASSGFGVHFARLLAARGANVVLAARRAAPMEALAVELRGTHRVQALVEAIDLSAPGAAAELARRLHSRGLAIDILVNNAGRGLYGDFARQPREASLDLLRLNVLALTELTHVFAAGMVKRRAGRILLVASTMGYQPAPGFAVYGASKAYVLQFGEALHAELAPYGVGVTVLAPGFAATSFAEVAGQRDSAIIRMMTMPAEPVARIGIEAMLRGRATVIPGFRYKLLIFLERFVPRALQRTFMQRIAAGDGPPSSERAAASAVGAGR